MTIRLPGTVFISSFGYGGGGQDNKHKSDTGLNDICDKCGINIHLSRSKHRRISDEATSSFCVRKYDKQYSILCNTCHHQIIREYKNEQMNVSNENVTFANSYDADAECVIHKFFSRKLFSS